MATVDVGSETYDAFADLDFANVFLAGDVARATAWAARTDDEKGRGLVSASRMLATLPWCDTVPPFDAVPEVVAEVTAMLAADLLASPKLFSDASGNSNIKSVKAGSAQVDFFSPVRGGPPIPLSLWNRLLVANLVCFGSSAIVLDGPYVSGISDGCRPLAGRYQWDWPIATADYG